MAAIDTHYKLKVCMYSQLFHAVWELKTRVVWTDDKYECEDEHALIIDNNWILMCAPDKEIAEVSSSILSTVPSLSPSRKIGKYVYTIIVNYCIVSECNKPF